MAGNFQNITIEDAIGKYFLLSKGQKSEILHILISESGMSTSTWVHKLSAWGKIKNYSEAPVIYRNLFTKVMTELYGSEIMEAKEQALLEEDMLLNED